MRITVVILTLAAVMGVQPARAQLATVSTTDVAQLPKDIVTRTATTTVRSTAQLIALLSATESGKEALAAAAAAGVPMSNTTTTPASNSVSLSPDTMFAFRTFGSWTSATRLFLNLVRVVPSSLGGSMQLFYPGNALVWLSRPAVGWYLVAFHFIPVSTDPPNEVIGQSVERATPTTIGRCDPTSNANSRDAAGVMTCVALMQISNADANIYVTFANTQVIQFKGVTVTKVN